jgi:adenylate cyclase
MERMDFTVIGDNVNLAARLCSAASKDEIIISESTYESAKSYIEAVRLEPIMVKGKANPIIIYKVIGLKNKEILLP